MYIVRYSNWRRSRHNSRSHERCKYCGKWMFWKRSDKDSTEAILWPQPFWMGLDSMFPKNQKTFKPPYLEKRAFWPTEKWSMKGSRQLLLITWIYGLSFPRQIYANVCSRKRVFLSLIISTYFLQYLLSSNCICTQTVLYGTFRMLTERWNDVWSVSIKSVMTCLKEVLFKILFKLFSINLK